jgi:hypothetical protein
VTAHVARALLAARLDRFERAIIIALVGAAGPGADDAPPESDPRPRPTETRLGPHRRHAGCKFSVP